LLPPTLLPNRKVIVSFWIPQAAWRFWCLFRAISSGNQSHADQRGKQMIATEKKSTTRSLNLAALTIAVLLAGVNLALAQNRSAVFSVTSTTFENDGKMPLTTLYNYQLNGVNICSIDGSAGGNQSPEISWTNVPRGTTSFAVVSFDTTAGVVQWGMYNIAGTATGLPQNAGVTGSSYGKQSSTFTAPLEATPT
jgi:phosphatidylethanolamine-binding protein (PEBP) family uncharacterized protein